MINKFLKTTNYKLKTSDGSIVMPVIFIVTIFAILLTSGKMVNVSNVDTSQKFSNPVSSGGSQKQNLQLKKLNFTLKPTSIPPTQPPSSSCNHDVGRPVDPNLCTDCNAGYVYCDGGLCTDYDPSKSGPGFSNESKEELCARYNQNKWCEPPYADPNQPGWYCIGKPVIYLYPEFPMLVDVRVKTAGKVVVSIPQIENYPGSTQRSEGGWTDVMAHPSGILFYKNHVTRELFYETETQALNAPEKGLVMNSEKLNAELLDFIKKLGLTKKDEQDEFMDWWIPRLESLDSPYWFVSILEKEEKLKLDKVEITPKPDTFIEFIVYFKPLDEFENVNPLELPETPKRIGFTAVEWGGVIGK